MPMALGVMADSYTALAAGGGGLPISGAVGWWDASDITSITQSGNLVSQWNDKSGGGRHFTQATEAAKPRINQAVRSGHAVLTFEGDDHIDFVGNTGLNAGLASLFIVAEYVSDPQWAGLLSAWKTGTSDNSDVSSFAITSGPGSTGLTIEKAGVTIAQVGPGGILPLNLYSVALRSDGTGDLWQNGVVGIRGTTAGTPSGIATGGYAIGSRWLGYYGYYFYGHIAEIIIYDRVVSDSERVQIEEYLWKKWIAPVTNIGLAGWWDSTDSSTFTYAVGPEVQKWRDKSGNERHATTTNGLYPRHNDFRINDISGIYFAPGKYLTLTAFASSFTAAELFMVLQLKTENTGGTLGNWGSGQNHHYPWSDGQIYEPWGTTGRHTLGNPTDSLLDPHIYNLRTAPDSYIAEINGNPLYSSVTNTVGFAAINPTFNQSGTYPADFVLGEVLMYNRVLTAPERQEVETYLTDKWFSPPSDPFAIVPWHAAFWASDPAWAHPADGVALTSWRDGSGNSRQLTQSVGAGAGSNAKFVAASSYLNDRPAVSFDGLDDALETTPAFSSISAPVSLVAVFRSATTVGDRYIISASPGLGAAILDGQYKVYCGGQILGGTANTSKHLLYVLLNGASSSIFVDGTQVASGTLAGNSSTGWILSAWANSYSAIGQNIIAFAGFKAGALTAQEHTDLLAWSRSYYGTP